VKASATQRPVDFKVEGGTVVGTLHIPKGEGKKPGVLLCHGFTGNRMEAHFLFVKMSKELGRRGMASLRFDFRGSGESDGEFRDMTILTEIADAKRALSFLGGAKGVDGERVGVLGLSLGGCVAACVSPDRKVRSLVLWSAVAHLKDLMDEMLAARMAELTGRSRDDITSLPERIPAAVDMGGHLVGRGFFETAGKVNPLDSLRRCRAPVLVVHGDSDKAVPMQHARDYYHAAISRGTDASLRVVAGGDHTFADAQIEKRVIKDTAAWFEETL
jgi:dipeptidyl aminopeptidase/acylaminoacyl peptidase